eukprot:354470-Chlamydomonas_euryale.AAC.44
MTWGLCENLHGSKRTGRQGWGKKECLEQQMRFKRPMRAPTGAETCLLTSLHVLFPALQLGDVYSYLKAEPYKAYTMLAQFSPTCSIQDHDTRPDLSAEREDRHA